MGMRHTALKAIVITTLCLALSASPSSASVSPNVSLHHWSYEALERLAASGLANNLMLNKRPLSRLEMAEILARIPPNGPVSSPILRRDLDRLFIEYRDELEILGVLPSDGQSAGYRIADPMRLDLIYADLDGFGRTPRENHTGDYYYGSMTGQLQVSSWFRIGDHLVADFAPYLTVRRDDSDILFRKAYLKGSFGNLSLEAGKDTLWWGPAYHGSLILSDNAPSLNMISVGSSRLFHLPGWFRTLGLWHIQAFISQLEKERDFPRARLAGMRIGLVPSKSVEVSLTRTVVFGGEQRPALDLSDYVRMLFAIGENRPGSHDNNQLAGIDFRISVPAPGIGSGLSIYGQLIGEDEANGLPSSHGFTGGLFLCDLLHLGLLDVRMEYAEYPLLKENSTWYQHHVYTSGYTYHRRLLGYPMGGFEDDYFQNGIFQGSSAWDVFLRITVHLMDHIELGLQYDHEHHRAEVPSEESKQEAVIDISARLADNIILKAGQEYEMIRNRKGMDGQDADNLYLRASIDITY